MRSLHQQRICSWSGLLAVLAADVCFVVPCLLWFRGAAAERCHTSSSTLAHDSTQLPLSLHAFDLLYVRKTSAIA